MLLHIQLAGKYINRKSVFSAIFCLFTIWLTPGLSKADTLTDASYLINEDKYEEARSLLLDFLDTPEGSKAASKVYLLLGECEWHEGFNQEAKRYFELAKQKGNVNANLFLSEMEWKNYKFQDALKLYNAYATAKNRDLSYVSFAETLKRKLDLSANALKSVQRIAVIDTLRVPEKSFFDYYRLSHESGSLRSPQESPTEIGRREASMVFVNESGDVKMWAQVDSTGNRNIVESMLLTDGTWQTPAELPEAMNGGGNADYPFMMPDGTTLYFASDGDESIGGYDIFVATRDAASGEYLMPQNLGMPFNSPFDDYMMAVDEENGFGWWASDREQLPGMVTIYVYLLDDMRKNIDPDNDSIIEYASLANPELTLQVPQYIDSEDAEGGVATATSENFDFDFEAHKKRLNELRQSKPDYRKQQFSLPIGASKVYHFCEDFKSAKAAAMMKDYLNEKTELDRLEKSLDALSHSYINNKADFLKEKIRELEKQIITLRKKVDDKLSDVYKEELQNL